MQFLILAIPAALVVLSLWRPVWALAALLAMFPLEILLQSSLPIFADRPALANMGIAGLLVAAVVRRAMSGEPLASHLFTPIYAICVLFYAWGYASALWSPTPGAFLSETLRAAPYWLITLGLAPLLLSRIEDVGRLCSAVIAIGTAIGVLMILNPNMNLVSGRLGIALGADTRGNPLAIGTLGGTIMIMGALTLLTKPAPLFIGLRIAAILVGAALAILSGSRGQMIAAVMAIVVVAPITYRLATARGLLLAGIAGVVFAAGLYIASGRFITRDNEQRWSSESLTTGGFGRLENAADLLSIYASSPAHWIQGLGLSAFGSINSRSGDGYTHVLFADALGEAGVVGATLLATAIVLCIRAGRRMLPLVRDDPPYLANLTVILALLVYHLLLANKEGGLLGSTTLFLFAMILGRVAREYEARLDQAWADDEAFETSEVELFAFAGNER
jgi:hypothetical protein